MSEVTEVEAAPLSALEDVERAVRPLRRVIARGGVARAAEDRWFAVNCARLSGALASLVLPEALGTARDAVVGAGEALKSGEPAVREAALSDVAEHLRAIDAVLGLPLRARNLVKRPPPRPKPGRATGRATGRAEPEGESPSESDASSTQDASKPASADATESAEAAEERGNRRGRRRRKKSRRGRDEARPARAKEPAQDDEPKATSRSRRVQWEDALSDVVPGVDDGRTVWQALTTRPASVDVRRPVHGAGRSLPEGPVAVGGRVAARTTILSPNGSRRCTVTLKGAGRLDVQWRAAWTAAERARLRLGDKVVLAAVVDAEGVAAQGQFAASHQGRAFVPTYDDPVVEEAACALVRRLDDAGDPLPTRETKRHGLMPLDEAVSTLHERIASTAAVRRLAFDEALTVQLALSHARFDANAVRAISHTIVHKHTGELAVRDLGQPLSDDAQVAFEAIKRDLRDSTPMRRVLAGMPGSGVDGVVLQTILTVAEGRTQVLVVGADVPAAVIAFDRWEPLLKAYGITSVLLGGEPSKADQEALRKGDALVVFAPPSIVDVAIDYRRLGLVIALEQATYGGTVLQRLTERSPRPDLLVATRTPLPAHVLWGAYPSFDVSVLPDDQEPASGTVWSADDREQAYAKLAEAVSDGGQALLVFPMRASGTDLLSLREAANLVATLKEQFLDGAEVALFHGALSGADRHRAWADFTRKRVPVLLATTLVEGLGVPPRPATVIVEHADRADTQRLLGLRALANGAGHVHYVLGAETSERGEQVVRALADGRDAGAIARMPEATFALGEGADAPRSPAFRFFDAAVHGDVVPLARDIAHEALKGDPQLRRGHGPALARHAHTVWGTLFEDAPCPLPEARSGTPRRRRRRRRRR